MGCSSSSNNNNSNSLVGDELHDLASPLTEKEIEMRIDAAPQSYNLTIRSVNMRFAWVSQRGYYPDAPDKENQDAFIILPSFGKANTANQALFGIFDGHGKDGHHCARYVRDHLPKNIIEAIDQLVPTNSVPCQQEIMAALRTAHLSTNEYLHADKRFDTTLSGTTSITVYFRGRSLYVSNVGDSRAIVISEKPQDTKNPNSKEESKARLVARALSIDQTPYRKDERERVKMYGARILSMEQIEGSEPAHENWGDIVLGEDIDEGGDPPRVWSPNGDYPGTAFTRSLGDRIAEECGVVAEPEIIEFQLNEQDRYLVIASDGVFEFLTNQMVSEVLSRFDEPLSACKALVNMAYNMWLQYEVRTDDITIICIYIDSVPQESSFANTSSFYTGQEGNSPMTASRKSQLKGSNHMVPIKLSNDKQSLAQYSPATSPKNADTEILRLGSGVSGADSLDEGVNLNGTNLVDVNLNSLQNRPVRRVMSREKRKHIIQLHQKQDDADDEASGGDITQEQAEALMAKKSDEDVAIICAAIKANFLFQHLDSAQRNMVIGVMTEVPVKAGDRIIKQGDRGDHFYIVGEGSFEVRVNPTIELANLTESMVGREGIESGSRSVSRSNSLSATKVDGNTDTPSPSHKSIKRIPTLIPDNVPPASKIETETDPDSCGNVVHVYESGPHQHPGFGELSLMYAKPRAASVIARTDGKLWALERSIFRRVVLRPQNMRRRIMGVLRKVEVLKPLNLTQIQRLTDLLSEAQYSAGETIISPVHQNENFYVICSGRCTNRVKSGNRTSNQNSPSGASAAHSGDFDYSSDQKSQDNAQEIVLHLKDYDYFGESALLEASSDDSYSEEATDSFHQKSASRSESVVADTDVRVFFIGRKSFEDVLGPLTTIIDNHRRRREAIAIAEQTAPHDINDIALRGIISSDALGPFLLGSFPKNAEPNLCVRTFLLSEVEKKGMEDSAMRFIDAAKAILTGDLLDTDKLFNRSVLVPKFLSFVSQVNAVHVLFDTPVVADLSSLIRDNSEAFIASKSDSTMYTFSCVVSALERLHSLNIIYRAVQPESLYVDALGRIVLLDFGVCKIGLSGSASDTSGSTTGKTYTMCGAADYLAPEQISQVGHSYPVDLWGLGVLLYELSVGSHPFSCASEVATYAKISSFGSKAFPALKFPDFIAPEVKLMINQLLMPIPEARIGAGSNGFHAIKNHPYFKGFNDWSSLNSGMYPSPLIDMALEEHTAVVQDGVDTDTMASFTKLYKGHEDRAEKWARAVEL